MIKIPFVQNKTIFVLGLGTTGNSVVQSMIASGATVICWDDSARARAQVAPYNVQLINPIDCDWQAVDAMVTSPGIPILPFNAHQAIVYAQQNNVPIYSDIDLYISTCKKEFLIAITGTNGKSTTTALITHLLQYAGKAVQVAGNIGIPVLDLKRTSAPSITVMELSSYQLELSLTSQYDLSILLNITPDHIAYHGSMEQYISAKKKIFLNKKTNQISIICIDDDNTKTIYQSLQNDHEIIAISATQMLEHGITCINGAIYDHSDTAHTIIDVSSVPNIKSINSQNLAAAYATCKKLGIDRENFLQGLQSFKGLEHRQEVVAVSNGIHYINDSKATNPESSAQALKSYTNIYWLVGGQSKDVPLDVLLAYAKHIRYAFLFGEAQEVFYSILQPHMQVILVNDLEDGLHQAQALAVKEQLQDAVILLSPACASFDMYDNFEQRGQHFKELVFKVLDKHTTSEF